MINKPTVLVLGAGASKPYGFPTGRELAAKVHRKLVSETEFRRRLVNIYGFRDQTPISALIEKFPQSGCETLDEFVETTGNRGFLPLVKASIVEELIECEQESWLIPALNPITDGDHELCNGDWYSDFFRQLRDGGDADSFGENLLKVITFNFDRSFERRLFLMLRSAYGVTDEQASRMCGVIKVLHLHGRLGGEKWLDENRSDSRDYAPTATADQRRELVSQIHLIHDEIELRELADAHRWLQEAHTICFMGFGYHRINMARLRMNEFYPSATIWGTTCGLSPVDFERAKELFASGVHFDQTRLLDCRRFLREVTFLPTRRVP